MTNEHLVTSGKFTSFIIRWKSYIRHTYRIALNCVWTQGTKYVHNFEFWKKPPQRCVAGIFHNNDSSINWAVDCQGIRLRHYWCVARDAELSKKLRGGGSNVVGIICPTGWNKVNWSAKNWGGQLPPPAPPASLTVLILPAWRNIVGRLGFDPTIFDSYLNPIPTRGRGGIISTIWGCSHQISNGSAGPV